MGFGGTSKMRTDECRHQAWPGPHAAALPGARAYVVVLGGTAMADRDEDRFRPRLGRPKSRDGVAAKRFVSRVVKAANEAGALGVARRDGTVRRRLSHLHRGAGIAAGLHRQVGPRDRRVLIKSRLVNLKRASPESTQAHLRYLDRDGADKDGGRAAPYGPDTDHVDLSAFEERGREDRHQFRFIVSPEDAVDLGELRAFTRELMQQVQKDLGTRLDWVAVDHWDTDNPHTHIVVRGKDQRGGDLIIAREYISHGMRARATELAGEWLGPRTEREIQTALRREVTQERWTNLDVQLQRQMVDGRVDLRLSTAIGSDRAPRHLLIGRVQKLQQMGLAREAQQGIWVISDKAQDVLRAAGERGDIIRTMQRAMTGRQRPIEIFDSSTPGSTVVGRIIDKGLADELSDRSYIVIDGLDGRAHYVALSRQAEVRSLAIGAVVEIRDVRPRAADRELLAQARDGIYDPEKHLASLKVAPRTAQDVEEFVTAHVRRLEALRRAGVVERLGDGRWRVPADLVSQGSAHDAQRSAGPDVRVVSELPIDRQVRAVGSTWLDRQLVGDPAAITDQGFGIEVRSALRARLAFLVDAGLAERRAGKVVLRGNLLATLRDRELAEVGRRLESELGLRYQPTTDGQRVTGAYRRSMSLVSGRVALLETDRGFALVPWRAVLDRRIGQVISGVVRGASVSWDFGRSPGVGR
jgi:type IV secretory pathway VirD2 relaxase